MRLPLIAALTLALALPACGGFRDSRLNPLNWFGRAQETEQVALTEEQKADPRLLVERVVSLNVEALPTGVIVRAKGLPPTQGWWSAELVERPVDENGVLVYDFRVFPPLIDTPEGTPRSREITVAASLSTVALDPIREIVVQGATNALSSRR